MYYYDKYGWLTDEVIPGRETETAPPTEIPEGYKQNWSGIEWVVIPYTENQEQSVGHNFIKIQEFFLLFTMQERIALRASNDPVIKEWMLYIYDIRITEVDIADKNMSDALLYATSIGILSAGRAERIIQGLRPE